MNRLKFSFLTLVFLILFSCTKEDNLTNSSSKIDTNLESRSVVIRTAPSVVSGILRFNDKAHLRTYWEDLESLDEDQLDSLETSYGYTSLRNVYNTLLNGGKVLEDELPFIVYDPFNEMVFNQYNELWVGDKIYKYVGSRLVSRTSYIYLSEVISMRGVDGIVRENTELIDMNTKETLPEPPVSTRTKCTMSITVPVNPTATNGGNDTYGYIQPIILGQDGNKVTTCAGNISINWGDGTSSSYTNSNIGAIRNHVYPVGPGECKSVKVTVTVVLTLCGQCTSNGNQTIITEQIIKICSPVSCTPFENCVDEKVVFLMAYSNNTRLAEFRMGYNADDYLWHDARAWGRIRHFSLNSFGGITGLVNPGFKLRVRIHGAIYEQHCNGNRIVVGKEVTKKTSDLKLLWKIDDIDFRLRSDDDLFADFEVFVTSNTIPDVTLYNRPFSSL